MQIEMVQWTITGHITGKPCRMQNSIPSVRDTHDVLFSESNGRSFEYTIWVGLRHPTEKAGSSSLRTSQKLKHLPKRLTMGMQA